MFKRIIGTFSNKLLATVLSFLLVVASSQILGASGKGEISMFIANITLIMHFGNLISGTSLTFLTPRIKPSYLLLPAYLWCAISGVGVSYLLFILGYVEDKMFIHLILLSTLYNLISTNYMILLGREKVGVYNKLTLLIIVITLGYFSGAYWLFGEAGVFTYIDALYLAYSTLLVFSLLSIRKEFNDFSIKASINAFSDLVKYGFTAQFSNIVTFMNYRFSYYVLNSLFDSSVVGVFSVGVAISEAMWLMSKSIALIQYTRIVNEDDSLRAQQMTFQMAKMSFWITLIFILIMIIMPDIFFSYLFGKEFTDAKYVIYSLSFGVLAIATSTTFSHYFGGVGKFNINNIASVVGLIFTIGLTYLLSKQYGMVGAGISASISYFCSAVYLYVRFNKESGFNILMLIPTKEDIRKLRKLTD